MEAESPSMYAYAGSSKVASDLAFARRLGPFVVVRLCPARSGCLRGHFARRAKCLLDACLRGLVLAVEAVGVDAEEHVDAGAGPLRDLCCGHSGVESGGRAGVA